MVEEYDTNFEHLAFSQSNSNSLRTGKLIASTIISGDSRNTYGNLGESTRSYADSEIDCAESAYGETMVIDVPKKPVNKKDQKKL